MPRESGKHAGAVHGRFQPFHNGHLRYVRMALERADMLYVGITNPDGTAGAEETDPVRHRADRNPFTFVERRAMVLRSIELSHPDSLQRIVVVPFELDKPEGWQDAIPLIATQYVAPHEDWDHEKATRFERAGYRVVFLHTEACRITATEVRRRIVCEDGTWRDLVPEGTADVLSGNELTARVRELSQHANKQKVTDGNDS